MYAQSRSQHCGKEQTWSYYTRTHGTHLHLVKKHIIFKVFSWQSIGLNVLSTMIHKMNFIQITSSRRFSCTSKSWASSPLLYICIAVYISNNPLGTRDSISWFYSCDKSSYIKYVYSQCHVDLLKCTEQNEIIKVSHKSHNFMFPFVLKKCYFRDFRDSHQFTSPL